MPSNFKEKSKLQSDTQNLARKIKHYSRHSEETNKLTSELFSKSIYLYDANTFKLIFKFSKHKDLVKKLKMSSKTLIKYKDSDKVFRNKYIISSIGSLSYGSFKNLYYKGEDVNSIRHKTDKSFGKNSALINQSDIITLSPHLLSKDLNQKEGSWFLKFKNLFLNLFLFILIILLYILSYMLMEVDITDDCNNDFYLKEKTEDIKPDKQYNILEIFLSKFNSKSKTLNSIEYPSYLAVKEDSLEDKFITKSNLVSLIKNKEDLIENCNVIDKIKDHHMEFLINENDKLKNKLSILEIELIRHRINELDRIKIIDSIIKELDLKNK